MSETTAVAVALDVDAAKEALSVARQEAADAADLVEALKEKVRAGKDVGPSEIASARDLAEHANLRVTAADRNLVAVRKAARLAKLAGVAEQMRARDSDAPRIAELMASITSAVAEILTVCGDRRQQMDGWRRVLHDEAVQQKGLAPAARDDGGVGWSTTGALYVDSDELGVPYPGYYVAAAVQTAIKADRQPMILPNGRDLTNILPDCGDLETDAEAFLARYL